MHRSFTRRQLLATTGAAAGSMALTDAAASTATPRRLGLDLTKPADNVRAYLKLRASTGTQDVYYWFTGRLDLAVADQPIRPIVDVESLILRRTERLGDLAWNVIDWEAAFYRDAETGAFIEGEVVNPATGRRVRPMPYREGPVRFRFTDQEPRILGSRDVMPKTGRPFSYPWRVVGDDLWMTKSSYIDVPHFLDSDRFPEASSGPRLQVATHSTLKAKLADVEDPDLPSVRADFSYTATSSWLPWMQMGRSPGHVVWAAAGRKLFSLEEAPAEQLAILRRVHPEWFGRPEPWPEFTNMYLQWKARQGGGSGDQ
jgi:hypothetical protein